MLAIDRIRKRSHDAEIELGADRIFLAVCVFHTLGSIKKRSQGLRLYREDVRHSKYGHQELVAFPPTQLRYSVERESHGDP